MAHAMVSSFKEITGCDNDTARFYLDCCGFDKEMALKLYLENQGSGDTTIPPVESGSSISTPSTTTTTTKIDTVTPFEFTPTITTITSTTKKIGLEFDPTIFGEEIQTSFINLMETGALSDVQLLVHGERIVTHKIILWSFSKVFQARIRGEVFEETLEVELPNKEEDIPVFKLMLRYMYAGCTGITDANSLDLLRLSHYFKVESLKEKCGEYIFSSQTETLGHDIAKMLDIAEKYECKSLAKNCQNAIAVKFEDCLKKNMLMGMSVDTWIELLNTPHGRLANQDEVFKAIIRYSTHLGGDVEAILKQLLPHVQFCKLSKRFLVEEVDMNEEFNEYPFIHHMIHRTYRQKLFNLSEEEMNFSFSNDSGSSSEKLWDRKRLSEGCIVEKDECTLVHSGMRLSSWLSACSSVCFIPDTGIYSWTIEIKKNLSNWLFFGVCTSNYTGHRNTSMGHIGNFKDCWAFGIHKGWGSAHAGVARNFGPDTKEEAVVLKAGDLVTLILDTGKARTLSIQINSIDCGVCHSDIAPGEVLSPAVSLYKRGDSIKLDPTILHPETK